MSCKKGLLNLLLLPNEWRSPFDYCSYAITMGWSLFQSIFIFMLMLIHFDDTFFTVENCRLLEIFRETALNSIWATFIFTTLHDIIFLSSNLASKLPFDSAEPELKKSQSVKVRNWRNFSLRKNHTSARMSPHCETTRYPLCMYYRELRH